MKNDDSEKLRTEIGLNHRELFELINENLPVGFFVVDADGIILEFNRAAEEITGITRERAKGKHCHEVLQSNLCDTSYCPLKLKKPGEAEPLVGQKAVIRREDGSTIPILYTSTPLKDKKGEIKGGIELFRDISEREQLERHRNILISMFAHDLKAPLAIAGGFLTRLLQGKAGPLNEKQQTYLDAIFKEIKKLEGYIHTILDILRLEAGKVPLSLEPCSIDKALGEMIAGFEVKAGEKDVSIRTEVPEQMAIINADKGQLQRAVGNLIDNAIKFSPKGGEVIIKVRETDDSILCEVRDSGRGIRKEDIPHVFDPFFRGTQESGSIEKKIGGSGLGLAIVKSVIEAHGGNVWVESEPGEGAVFRFTIPKDGKREADHGSPGRNS